MKLLKVLLLCLFISTIPVYGEIEEAVDPTSVSLRGIIEWVKNFDFVTYVGQTDNINAVNGRDGQWLIKETTAGISIYICWNGDWQPFIVSRLDNDIVETINLKDRSVTSVKIALSTIKGENVEPNTIEGSNLKDNSVITAKIADGNVTKPKLANSSVGNAQLENLSISSEKLRSGAVTSDKIAQELENKTIKLIDGSIAEPSLSFDNNSISGLSYNATDSQMIVSYNNTEKIRIDNDVTFINLSELKLNSNIDSAISFNDNSGLNKVSFKYHVASETFTIQSQPDSYSLGFTESGKLVFNAPTNVDLNTYDNLYPNYDVVLTGDSVIENVLSNKSTSDIFILNGIASTSLPIGLPESGVIYYNSTNNRFYGKSNDVWDILNVRNNDFTLAGLSEKNFSSLNNKPTTLSGYGITDGVNTSDSRLTDARTPLAHAHGSITNDGKIGSTSGLVVTTTTGGVLTTSSRSGIDSRATFPPSTHTHEYVSKTGDTMTGALTIGTDTSTNGSTMVQSRYPNGAPNLLGTMRSSGGTMLGYGLRPSNTVSNGFESSVDVALSRSAMTLDGGGIKFFTAPSSTTAIGTAITPSEVFSISNNGAVSIPQTLSVTNGITGNLTGTASKATADASGNTITATYATKSDNPRKFLVTPLRNKTYRIGSITGHYNGITLYCGNAANYDNYSEITWLIESQTGIITEVFNACAPLNPAYKKRLHTYKDASNKVWIYLVCPNYNDSASLYLDNNTTSSSFNISILDVTDTWATEIADKTLLDSNPTSIGGKGITSNGFFGNLTGNVTGNVTGNLTGNADTANVANALDNTVDVGNTTTPVYFKDGLPMTISYTIAKSVPSNAVFTDTTYSNMVGATTSVAGTAGLVPAPSAGEATRYLRSDGTWQVPPDTNTTYSANNGVSLSGTTFSNSGVRSIATGGTNGTISVNTNGTSADVAVKGLGTAAYTASTAYAASGHTHNYAGSSSAGGAATSANKLNTNAGSVTQPVYFANGVPVATTYSLGKSVPSNAVFTDTTYSNMVGATTSATGTAGLVPAPSAGAATRYLRSDGTWQIPPTPDVVRDFLKTSIDSFSCAEFKQSPILLRLVTMPSELTTPHIFEWINEDYSVGVATYTDGPTHGKGSNAFIGSTLLPNGKVMLTPYVSANIGIYDPVANTYTNGPTHGKGSNAFIGSTLLPNGKVMLTPHNSTNIGIYDPVANTYTNGPTHGKGSIGVFAGSTLLPNGKVMLTPYNSTNIGIYDPITDKYTDGPTHGKGSYAFYCSTMMPNGKVMLTPYNSANIGIYDPINNTYTDGPLHGKDLDAFYGSTLMPNGKVMLTPYNSTNIGIYDPIANTYTDGPLHGKGTNAFVGSTLMPNGKVMLTPRNSANIGIYDPVANTYTNGPAHGKGGAGFFYGSTMMPNGKVMLTPRNSANIGIYDPAIIDLELRDWPLLSAYFNKL